MKTSLFIIIVLVSGALAGMVHGTVNFAVVEPYLDQAIGIENQNLFESGEEEDTPEFWVDYEGYRDWQEGWPDLSRSDSWRFHRLFIWNCVCICKKLYSRK